MVVFAVPFSIDVYFENVGGDVLDAVHPLFNNFARMPICGMIAQYNATDIEQLVPRQDRLAKLMVSTLVNRVTIRGFLWFDEADLVPEADRKLKEWFKEGKLKAKEDIVE
eukprot:TRINITY_DN6107_c0_g1_i1.p3 TRINITY_DN6107_c0_g1~~TRINITY_DN6107_c0_g1_i1.p3  ORF type:complete len:110 (+),score=27.03 TRINITY_DN6107_c0_g1_i1:730-1059(+)